MNDTPRTKAVQPARRCLGVAGAEGESDPHGGSLAKAHWHHEGHGAICSAIACAASEVVPIRPISKTAALKMVTSR